jgi:hypothetical protein
MTCHSCHSLPARAIAPPIQRCQPCLSRLAATYPLQIIPTLCETIFSRTDLCGSAPCQRTQTTFGADNGRPLFESRERTRLTRRNPAAGLPESLSRWPSRWPQERLLECAPETGRKTERHQSRIDLRPALFAAGIFAVDEHEHQPLAPADSQWRSARFKN